MSVCVHTFALRVFFTFYLSVWVTDVIHWIGIAKRTAWQLLKWQLQAPIIIITAFTIIIIIIILIITMSDSLN